VPELGPEIETAFALYERLWRHKGGDARFGGRQRSLLRAAGIERLETRPGAMALHKPGDLFLSRFTAPDFVEQVVGLGWTDRTAVERWSTAIQNWNQHPDALWACMLLESVAWID
jgi:hypothetical protein